HARSALHVDAPDPRRARAGRRRAGRPQERGRALPRGVSVFRTALCELLAIEYPIVQSGMGGVAGPELVAEVCRAGGLGILAGLNVPPDDLRKMIRTVRGLTDRPFGVNLWLHKALRPPIDPDTVPAETLYGAQAMLNRFRERLGIPKTTLGPGRAPDLVDAAVAVVLEERPPAAAWSPPSPSARAGCCWARASWRRASRWPRRPTRSACSRVRVTRPR